MDEQGTIPPGDQATIPPNRSTGKAAKKPKPKSSSEGRGKRGINLSMPQEDYERFYIHALRLTGGNISELVCRLGREHLRDFHIARTATRSTDKQEHEHA
jgi:hypothetical protein